MDKFEMTVDFNGIVLFEPARLEAYFGGKIDAGQNLYRTFTTTEAGDEVVQQGCIVPILGINDGIYKVSVRLNTEPSSLRGDLIVVENAGFPLQVETSVVLADMAVLWEWERDTGWLPLTVPPGFYSVVVRGYREILQHEVVDCGYEFVLDPQTTLPPMTASMTKDMQVLCLPTS